MFIYRQKNVPEPSRLRSSGMILYQIIADLGEAIKLPVSLPTMDVLIAKVRAGSVSGTRLSV